jgi:hypothetical protein
VPDWHVSLKGRVNSTKAKPRWSLPRLSCFLSNRGRQVRGTLHPFHYSLASPTLSLVDFRPITITSATGGYFISVKAHERHGSIEYQSEAFTHYFGPPEWNKAGCLKTWTTIASLCTNGVREEDCFGLNTLLMSWEPRLPTAPPPHTSTSS